MKYKDNKVDIQKSKEMMESLLDQTWDCGERVLDKKGNIIIPQPEEFRYCLRLIKDLFFEACDIFDGNDKNSSKDQLKSINRGIERISESLESAYLMPSREFLTEKLSDALDIIEEQDKEMDSDSKHYANLMLRIEKRFGEEVADDIYWGTDD